MNKYFMFVCNGFYPVVFSTKSPGTIKKCLHVKKREGESFRKDLVDVYIIRIR